jgi:hypothetical protein
MTAMDSRALYVPTTIADPTNTRLIALRGGYSMEVYRPPLLELSPAPTEDKGERKLIALVGKAGTGKHTYLRDYYSKKGPLYIPYATGFIEQSGMHPAEQRDYIEKIKLRANAELPDPYMFVTHSPYIMDEMGWGGPHEVIVFHRSKGDRRSPDQREGGRYYRAPLTSHPDIEWGMQTLTLGKFWDAEGESWLEEHGEDVTFPEAGVPYS